MIETERLRLINFTHTYAEEMSKGDEHFAKAIGITLLEDWSEEKIAIETFYNDMQKNNSDSKWWAYLIINKCDNKFIGCAGYKGEPNDAGEVEIGYEIHHQYRNKGLATEAAKALTGFALTHPEVKKILAHTLAEENSSGAILKKLKFSFVKQYTHSEDGEVWQWQYLKPQ